MKTSKAEEEIKVCVCAGGGGLAHTVKDSFVISKIGEGCYHYVRLTTFYCREIVSCSLKPTAQSVY